MRTATPPAPPPAPPDDLRKVGDVAKRLSLGRSTIYDLMNSGQLAYVKIGRSRRIPVAAVEKLLAENTVEATS